MDSEITTIGHKKRRSDEMSDGSDVKHKKVKLEYDDLRSKEDTKHDAGDESIGQEAQLIRAAAILQLHMKRINNLDPVVLAEIMKVLVTMQKLIYDSNPNILGYLSEDQLRVVMNLSQSIKKDRHCRDLKIGKKHRVTGQRQTCQKTKHFNWIPFVPSCMTIFRRA